MSWYQDWAGFYKNVILFCHPWWKSNGSYLLISTLHVSLLLIYVVVLSRCDGSFSLELEEYRAMYTWFDLQARTHTCTCMQGWVSVCGVGFLTPKYGALMSRLKRWFFSDVESLLSNLYFYIEDDALNVMVPPNTTATSEHSLV